MEETNQILEKLLNKVESIDKKIDSIETNIKKEFAIVNKRLDSIEHELRKLNTVTKYQETYDNIPA